MASNSTNFKQYRTWDATWKRQYLEQLKASARPRASRQRFVPIQRESDGVLVAYLDVRNAKFPLPSGNYSFSHNSWLCDDSQPHPPVTVLDFDYYGTDKLSTICRSTHVLTGNRYYYRGSNSWTVTNGQVGTDRFWVEIWRMSPNYRTWTQTDGSTLNVVLGLHVHMTDELVGKLQQVASTQTVQTDPAYIPCTIQDCHSRVFRDDNNATITYMTEYSMA